MRLGVRVGQGCSRVLDVTMRDLPCERLELDEIWGFVDKKEMRVQPADDPQFGSVWAWCEQPERYLTVLHIPPVVSPQIAVQAAILQEYKSCAKSN